MLALSDTEYLAVGRRDVAPAVWRGHRVDGCDGVALDVPQVEEGTGAGDDVASQLVDVDRSHWPGVSRQGLDVDVSAWFGRLISKLQI